MLRPKHQTEPDPFYFKTLNLHPSASSQEIKKAYRIQARICHPSGSEPNEERFRYLSHIYRVLANPLTREEYLNTMGRYISDWELQELKNKSPEVIDRLVRIERIEDEFSEPIPEGYSFWGNNRMAQEWYPFLISALAVDNIEIKTQIGVADLDEAYVLQPLLTGSVVFWFSSIIRYPNFFTAYSASQTFLEVR